MKARAKQSLKLEWRGIDSLTPYARNARTHSDAQIAQIAASIKEFGWTNPVLVDGSRGVIAGHARLQAARKLSMKRVPVIELSHLTAAQKRAYIIADNKLTLNAGWDNEILTVEFAELRDMGCDLDLTGFNQREQAAILRAAEEPAADESAQLRESYRVLVDCRDEEQQMALLERLMGEGYQCRTLIS